MSDNKEKKCILTLEGLAIRIDPEKVDNVHLQDILRTRFSRKDRFMFYSDDGHTEHTESPYREHSEYQESSNHTDHTDTHTDYGHNDYDDSYSGDWMDSVYNEFRRHTDTGRHTDNHTDHK